MAVNIFPVLTCYYMIKPVREALSSPARRRRDQERLGWAGHPLLSSSRYSSFANRVNCIRLISWVTAFFMACLVGFYSLRARVPMLGIAFFSDQIST
jgi:hypothetical protein